MEEQRKKGKIETIDSEQMAQVQAALNEQQEAAAVGKLGVQAQIIHMLMASLRALKNVDSQLITLGDKRRLAKKFVCALDLHLAAYESVALEEAAEKKTKSKDMKRRGMGFGAG